MPSSSSSTEPKSNELPPRGTMTLDQLSQAFSTLLEGEDHPIAGVSNSAEAASVDSDGSVRGTSTADSQIPLNTNSIVESLLFVGQPDNLPITREQLTSLIRGAAAEEIDQTITDLNAQYEANGCPYIIVLEDAGYRLQLRSEFIPLRDRFYGRLRAARLSPAAVEVLSLVAYHELLTADDVARLRGTPSSHILNNLVRRRLLRIERSDKRPMKKQYFITPRFLKLFHLRSLDDLPRSDDLQKQ